MTEQERLALTKYDLYFESRVSKLEVISEKLREDISDIKREMKTDFRWIITLMIMMLGVMAKGFHWV